MSGGSGVPCDQDQEAEAQVKIIVGLLVVLAVLVLVGCKNQVNDVEPNVKPGAFCGKAGDKGITDKGQDMVCKTARDGKLRWQTK